MYVSHELLIIFHKESDDPTPETLPESRPIGCPDLGALEPSVEDTLADLGDRGRSLHQYSEGCFQLTHGLT